MRACHSHGNGAFLNISILSTLHFNIHVIPQRGPTGQCQRTLKKLPQEKLTQYNVVFELGMHKHKAAMKNEKG